MSEERIYPPQVWRYDPPGSDTGSMVDYDLYHRTMRDHKVGDVLTTYAGAPGTGYVQERITRMDETGVYGVVVRDTMRQLEPGEVM